MHALDHLGWDRYRDRLADDDLDDLDDGCRIGRVRRVDRGEVDVVVADGEIRAVSDSRRAQDLLAPATGDWVRVRDDGDGGVPIVAEVLPRVTAVVRRDPAEKEVEQVLVANVDAVGVVAGVDRPANIARIERFLVLAQDTGADALVVLTKVDLGLDESWRDVLYQMHDVPTILTSALTGAGLDELRDQVADHRSLVLLGESGSGKSTLVNALVGDEIQDTAEVRHGDAKGRHTTTARELIVLPGGGILIDTPGVRGVGLWDAEEAVQRVFADIAALAAACRFNDCRHEVEPGCAVLDAVDRGEIDRRRLERYHRLRAELDLQAERLEEQRRRPRGRRRR